MNGEKYLGNTHNMERWTPRVRLRFGTCPPCRLDKCFSRCGKWDMGKTAISKLGVAIVATILCGAAMGQELQGGAVEPVVIPYTAADASRITFASNLFVEPCGGCNYDSSAGGYFLWGPDNCTSPDRLEWLAVPFIASATGVPKRISAAIILTDPTRCPENNVTLSIYTDACYPTGPGEPLVSGIATAVEAPCDLAVARLHNAPSLTKGTKYWVVATTNARQSGLDSNWYGSNNAQYAVNLGDGWQQFAGGTPAFMVQGSSTVLSQTLPDASHPALGGNLFIDPCTGCNYDPNGLGFPVFGPENCTSPGTTTWLGVPFVAARSGVPKRISASIILYNPTFCPENRVTLSLYTDNCGLGPGTPLVSGIATVPTAPCDLAVARLRNAPTLTEGTKYWVVATTNEQQAGLNALWYGSNDNQIGLNLGDGWTQFGSVIPGFMVQ